MKIFYLGVILLTSQLSHVNAASPKVAVITGSARGGSINAVLSYVAQEIAKKNGAEVTWIAPEDMEKIPLYNGDLEDKEGFPTHVLKIIEKLESCNFIFIACPIYNHLAITPVLLNTIAWLSRKKDKNGKSCGIFRGKKVILASASPGGRGGAEGLNYLKEVVENLHAEVLPKQFSIGNAKDASVIKKLLASDSPDYKELETVVKQIFTN